MNRCKISVWILIGLVLLCISSLPLIRYQCSRFIDQVDSVTEAVKSGDRERALAEYDALEEAWTGFHDITGIFVDGEKLDVPREVLVGLRSLIEAEHPEALSELERLRGMTEGIFEEEVPGWEHIL